MYQLYQFRFGVEGSEISKIFKDPEISKAFKAGFMDNYALLLNRIREYQKFILSKNNTDCDPDSYAIKLSEDEIIANFKESLQQNLLHSAIQLTISSSSKFNVKANILEILKGSFIEDNIMGKLLLSEFQEAVVSALDSSIGPSLETLEALESEFLQK